MSKKPRQHWQTDSHDYTFNQYSFYLFLLGLLITGLLVGFYIFNKSPIIPRTHLVSITSKPGGELPVIPFQNEDALALSAAFDGHQRYEFDDLDSFHQNVIEELVDDCQKNQDVDTVLIWLSAIGSIQDGQPVILGSARNNRIEFDSLLEDLEKLKAASVVLLLDCGHAYVNPAAYEDTNLNSDLNQFSQLVRDRYADRPVTAKVQVLINGAPGERPMHSITRRRSLFALAFEKVFTDNDQKTWTLSKLQSALDNFSLKYGGTVAPQVTKLGTELPAEEFFRPVLIAKDEATEEQPEDKDKKELPAVKIAAETSEMSDSLVNAWTELQKQRKDGISPAVVDPVQWQALTRDLIERTADQLGPAASVQSFNNLCQAIPLALQKNDQAWFDKTSRLKSSLQLVPPVDVVEPTIVLEKRELAKAYLDAYELQQRIPNYLALAEGLLWLYPTDEEGTVEIYRSEVSSLVGLFNSFQPPKPNFAPLQPASPSLDDLELIRSHWRDLKRSEERLGRLIKLICNNLGFATAGCQREMVIESLLRLPFLASDPPDVLDPESKNENRIPSRRELLNLLAEPNPPYEHSRTADGNRKVAATKRVEMYRKILTQWSIDAPHAENTLSLRLQTYAYRLFVPSFDFEQFRVADRKPLKRVVVRRRDDLLSAANYIERVPTVLDLGLEVQNTSVKVRCELLQNGDFFTFPDGSKGKYDFTGNPQLIASIEAPEIDPACLLHVTVVDQDESVKVPYDEFDIPIRLPSKDMIELIVEVGDRKSTFLPNATGDPIRPFANRPDLPCAFSLRDNWHGDRTVSVFLYACESPTTRTIPGKINDEVRQNTNDALKQNSLAPIATADVELKKGSTKSSEPLKIQWKKPAAAAGESEESPSNAGLLCVIKRPGSDDWQYWIPIFPVENPVLVIEPRVESGDLTLIVDRQEFFPTAAKIDLNWSFSRGQLTSGKANLGAGDKTIRIPVAKNVSQILESDSFLYIDVDGWPRKYAFKFNGQRFRTVSTFDAIVEPTVGEAIGTENPKSNLVPLPTTDDWIRYGTRASDRTAQITVSPNVPSDNVFLFSESVDCIRLFQTGDPNPLYYPREISHLVKLNEKSGDVGLVSKVSDHKLTFANVGSHFRVSPVLHLGPRGNQPEQNIPLQGKNRIDILFDQTAPKIEDFKVNFKQAVYPNDSVLISIEASDNDGVGIDWNRDVKIFRSEPNGSLADLEGKPVPSEFVKKTEKGGTFRVTAPQEVGKYTLGVKIADRVGNVDEDIRSNRVFFTVAEKPIPRDAKPGGTEPSPPPKVYTHSLVVTVSAADLANVDGLSVSIDPPDSAAIVNGNNYTFRNLKGDVTYQVTVTGKIKRGISAGDELSASGQETFPEKAIGPLTRPMSLKLGR